MTFWEAAIHYLLRAAVVGVALLFAGIPLPRRIFHADRFPFKSYPFEKDGRIYQLIQVHKWKDLVPDASRILKMMTKKRLSQKADAKALERLIQETCVAEIVHWMIYLFIPVYSIGIPFGYALVMSLLYIAGNMVFIVIQRYNRPRFQRALELYIARENRRNAVKEKNQ